MILVDSSAWVEFDRATGSPTDLALTELIASGGPAAITEPILMEVCAGARDAARERDLRRLLGAVAMAHFDAGADFNAAVTVYRTCRRAGVTPRGLLDCMIGAVALRGGHEVLAHDRDFALMADAVGLTLHPASLTR